jgi:hypothetical protein
MGMIFNTQKTVQLLGFANGALVANGFIAAANNAALKTDLASVGTTKNLKDHIWTQHLGLGDAGVPKRLRFWLVNVLQSVQQTGHYLDYWIAQWMLNALNNTGRYAGIEFFVVPDANLSVSYQDFLDVNNGSGKYTLIITIHTDVVDKYNGHPASNT